jgi:hypothetical protein
MGGWVSKLQSMVWGKKDIRILILGLVCEAPSQCDTSQTAMLTASPGQRWQDHATLQTQGQGSSFKSDMNDR